LEEVNPNPEMKEVLEAAYARWKKELWISIENVV
jgi:hypothetical protein